MDFIRDPMLKNGFKCREPGMGSVPENPAIRGAGFSGDLHQSEPGGQQPGLFRIAADLPRVGRAIIEGRVFFELEVVEVRNLGLVREAGQALKLGSGMAGDHAVNHDRRCATPDQRISHPETEEFADNNRDEADDDCRSKEGNPIERKVTGGIWETFDERTSAEIHGKGECDAEQK